MVIRISKIQPANGLAIVFPGIGYKSDMPLLYYAQKTALQCGYDVYAAEYDIPSDVPLSEIRFQPIIECLKTGIDQAIAETKPSRLLFIGKSIGCLVAAKMAEYYGQYDLWQICLTPAYSSADVFSQHPTLIVTGDRDPLFQRGNIDALERNPNITLEVIPGADHALENNANMYRSVENLKQTVHTLDEYIQGLTYPQPLAETD